MVAKMRAAFVDHLARADDRAVAAALSGAAQSDLPPPDAFRSLDAPTLILSWRGDPVHPVSTARRLAEVMPHAELAVAQGLEDLRGWPDRVHAFLDAIEE